MKEKIISDITGKSYFADEVIRIVNPVQSAFYVLKGLELLDLYTSFNKQGKPCQVQIFNRNDSKDIFDQWCKNKE